MKNYQNVIKAILNFKVGGILYAKGGTKADNAARSTAYGQIGAAANKKRDYSENDRKTTKGKFEVRNKKNKVVAIYDTKEQALNHSYRLYGGINLEAYNAVSPAKTKINTSTKKKGETLAQEASRNATAKRNAKPQVLRADRKAEGTLKETKAGKAFSKYATFLEAYNAAIGRGDMYFDYKGKVYTLDADDLAGIKKAGRLLRDNRAAYKARYGKYPGWSKDPNMGKSSVEHTTKMKDESLGGNPGVIPAELPVRNNLANWNWMEGYPHTLRWSALDYVDLGDKTAYTGAGTAALLGGTMLLGSAMPYMYETGLYLLNPAAANAERTAAQGAVEYGNWGNEISNGARMAEQGLSNSGQLIKHVPNSSTPPAGWGRGMGDVAGYIQKVNRLALPRVPANGGAVSETVGTAENVAPNIANYLERIGYLSNPSAGPGGTGLLLGMKKGGTITAFKYRNYFK